jgi:putative hydrolase of the HAD superfamily
VTPIEGLVFDLDGTLLDHRSSVTAALRGWLPELGAALDDDLLAAWLAAEQRHFRAWQTRQISFPEQRRRRLRDFLPLIRQPVGQDDQLDADFQGYLRWYKASWTAFEDTHDAVAAVARAGLRTAVLTNGATGQQNAKIEKIGLTGRLGPVLTAEELGVAKPDPRTYAAACRRLELPTSQVLHVGDLYDLDVLAPRKAGLHAVHLDRIEEGPHDEPERITSLAQLADYIAGLDNSA